MLNAVTHHWGDYEASRIRALQAGQWKARMWLGMKQGAIRVDHLAPCSGAGLVAGREAARQAGILPQAACTRSPARCTTRTANWYCPQAKPRSDAQILKMNWLVQGVQASGHVTVPIFRHKT